MKQILLTIAAVVLVGCSHSTQSNLKNIKSLNKSVDDIPNGVLVESGPVNGATGSPLNPIASF